MKEQGQEPSRVQRPTRYDACRIVAEVFLRQTKNEARGEPAVHSVRMKVLFEIREEAERVRSLYAGLIESAILPPDFLDAFNREIEELAPEDLYPK